LRHRESDGCAINGICSKPSWSFKPAFELIGAVNWLSLHHRQELHDACPILMQEPEREPASFWFRRVDAAEK
jgi:hypothetical protein